MSSVDKPSEKIIHLVYLDAFLEKRMASPYNIVWGLREGMKQLGGGHGIEFICGNASGESAQPLGQSMLGKRDIVPSLWRHYWKQSGFLAKCVHTFFDRETRSRLKDQVVFLEYIDHMTLALGRIDPFLDTVHSIHVFSTVDALRMHNYLVHVSKRHHVKLMLSFYTPGAPALDWVRSYTNIGFFSFALKKLIQNHTEADIEAIRVCDILVFPSPQSMEAYATEIDAFETTIQHKDIRFLSYGSDILRPTVARDNVRKLFAFEDKFVVSFVGHHSPMTGYDQLKRVGKKLLGKHADMAFLIGGPQNPMIGINHARWFECGFTREMDNVIEAGDVYVSANQQVLFNPIITEVLSRGILIAATRVGGNKIFEGASSGLRLFSTDEELAQILESFKNASASEREAMASANRALYEKKFTNKNFALSYSMMVKDVHQEYRLGGGSPALSLVPTAPHPEISVLIPVYNVEAYIEECIGSILRQTFTNFEIVAVDNGSVDRSGEILARLAVQDDRIRVITLPQNRGMARARNIALDAARGTYISLVDSDDRIEPDMLERLYDCCRAKGYKMATCAFSFFDGASKKTHFHSTFTSPETRDKYLNDGEIDLSDHRAIGHMFMAAWNALYHRSLFDDVRYHQRYDDISTNIQILAGLKRVGHVPRSLYYYRLENPNRIVKDVSPRIFDIFHIMDFVRSELYEVMKKDAARVTYRRYAIEAIRYRATLAAKDPAMRRAFWKRSNRFFRQEGLSFDYLMSHHQPGVGEEQMLDFYCRDAWQKFWVKRGYRWRCALRHWARFLLEPLLWATFDVSSGLQSIEELLENQKGRTHKFGERNEDLDRDEQETFDEIHTA